MKVSRRTLIGGGIAATGLVAAGGAVLLAPAADARGTIAAFIAREVPGVSADDEAVTRFADDAVINITSITWSRIEDNLAYLAHPGILALLPEAMQKNHAEFVRSLMTKFMLSTDYLTRSGSARPVSYIGFAEPYLVGCSNPLAQFV